MRSISILSLAAVSALAFAPAAFAQDATAQKDIYGHSVSNDTASGKHWAVVGGVTGLRNKDNPASGVKKVDSDVAATISASYFIDDNWAVELWGAVDKFDGRVHNDAGRIGSFDQRPVALSGQYHFGQADDIFRPFVGVGYYVSDFSNENLDALSPSGNHVSLDKAKGVIGTAGVDMNINSTWFARVDARYLRANPDVRVADEGSDGSLKLDPWVLGVGLGARF